MQEASKKELETRSPLVPVWLARLSVITGLLVVFGAGVLFLVTEVVVPIFRSEDARDTGPRTMRTGPQGSDGTQSDVVYEGAGVGEIFALGEFLVNPAGSQARRFIRVNVALELADASIREPLEFRAPEVKDLIIRELTSRTVEQLADPVGKEELRAAMITELNRTVAGGAVSNLYFSEYVIQ